MNAITPPASITHMGRTRTPAHRQAALLCSIALVGFHVSSVTHTFLFGREYQAPVSLELVLSLPVVIFAVDGCKLLLRSPVARLPLLAYTGFVGWVLLAAFFSPPNGGPRALVGIVGQLALLCGAASLFYRSWPAILAKLPTTICIIVIVFMAWLLAMRFVGGYEAMYLDKQEDIVRYNVGNLRPTEIAFYLGAQLCYLLFLLRRRRSRSTRIFTIVSIVTNLWLVFAVTVSRAAIASSALVMLLFFSTGSMMRKVRIATASVAVVCILYPLLLPYFSAITRAGGAMLAEEDGEAGRSVHYREMLRMATDKPLFGIGHYNFEDEQLVTAYRLAPHQNLIGRACENGFPAAVLYGLFVLASVRALSTRYKSAKVSGTWADADLFKKACLCILIYLELRGLFTDTWALKELAFAVGAGLGLFSRLQAEAARSTAPGRKAPAGVQETRSRATCTLPA